MKKLLTALLLVMAVLLPFTMAHADLDLSSVGLTIELPERYEYEEPNAEAREYGCVGVYYADDRNIELDVYIDTIDDGSSIYDLAETMRKNNNGSAADVLTINDVYVAFAKYNYKDGSDTVYAVTYFISNEDEDLVVLSFFHYENRDLSEFDEIIHTVAPAGLPFGELDTEIRLGGYTINMPTGTTVSTDKSIFSEYGLSHGVFAYCDMEWIGVWVYHREYNGQTLQEFLDSVTPHFEESEILDSGVVDVGETAGLWNYCHAWYPEYPDADQWFYKLVLPDGDEVLFLDFIIDREDAAWIMPEILSTLRR